MAEVPTVRIHLPHESGKFAIINKADFDPAMHVLFDDDVSRETDAATRDFPSIPAAPRKRGRPRKDS